MDNNISPQLSQKRSSRQAPRQSQNQNQQVIIQGEQIHIYIEVDCTAEPGTEEWDLYNNYYQNVKDKILEKVPHATVERRDMEEPHCFEIKENIQDHLIWSKLGFQQFPDPHRILDRILCFYFDALNGGDIRQYETNPDISSENKGYRIDIWEKGTIKIQKANTNFRIKRQPSNASSQMNSQNREKSMNSQYTIPSETLNPDLVYLYQNYDCTNCQSASRVFQTAIQSISNKDILIKEQADKISKLEEKAMEHLGNDSDGHNRVVQQLLDQKNFQVKREKMLTDEKIALEKEIIQLQNENKRYDDEVEDQKKQIMEIKRHINPELEEDYENLQAKIQDMKVLEASQAKQIEDLQYLANKLEVKHLELQRQLKNRDRDLLISKSRIQSMEKLLKIKTMEAKEGSDRLKWERKEKDQKIVRLEMVVEDQQQKIDILQENMTLKLQEKETEIEEYQEMKYNFHKILQGKVNEYEDKMKKLIKMHKSDKEKMSEYFYYYKEKHQIIFKPYDVLNLGFVFKGSGNPAEYEAKAISLHDLREIDTQCNLKFKYSDNQEFLHQGQRNTSIYHQEIIIDLKKIPLYTGLVAITITSSQGLQQIKDAIVHVAHKGQICEQYIIKNILGTVKSYLVMYIRRQEDGQWRLMPINKGLDQLNEPKLIIDNLNLSGYDFGPISESYNWNERFGKIYQITNNQVIAVPSKAYDNFTLGLGWDSKTDLDGSAIMFDKNGVLVDNVYFQNLISKDEAVQHQGDEQEGKEEGDDEQIKFSLNKIDPQVESIWIFICIYEKDQQFDDVEGAYGRFLVGENEFCRYNMSESKDATANGCLMCNLFRVKKKWMIKGRGYFTKDTYTSEEVIPIIKEVCENNYEHVKIYTNEVEDEEEDEERMDIHEYSNKEVMLDKDSHIKVWFKWNCNIRLSALNAHAFLLNDDGEKIGTVNMRETNTQNNCLTHSGKTKERDYDQEIQVMLPLINEKVYTIAFVITALSNLNELTKDGKITVQQQGTTVHQQNFTQHATGKTYLSFFITRAVGNNFKLLPCQASFQEANLRKILKESMHLAGKKAKVNMDALNWNADSLKSFKLESEMVIPLPKIVQEEMIIGLGWDTPLDLDSSVILLDKNGFVIDNIWWNNLECKGIVHQGDNRTGAEEGDDETIKVNLLKINENVSEIWVFVCLFEKENNFIDVNGEYFRIVVHGKEFARMDLGEIEDSEVNGCILCCMYKQKNQWFLKGKGYYTMNTYTSQDVEPVIRSVSKDDLGQVKIFNNVLSEEGGQMKKLTKYPYGEKLQFYIHLEINKEHYLAAKNPMIQMIVRYIDIFGNVMNKDYLLDYKKIQYSSFLSQKGGKKLDYDRQKSFPNTEFATYEITLNFAKIPKDVYCLSFMLNCNDLYKVVSGAQYEMGINDDICFQYQSHMPIDKTQYQNVLMFFLHLDIQNNWQLIRINGTDFQAIGSQDKLISKYIDKIGIDQKVIKQSQEWRPDARIMFNMRQGDTLIIPPSGYGGMQLGLGWVTDLDVDCSLIMITEDNQCYDYIYYKNLKSKDTSIMHLGDAKQGADGDSEVLSIILKQVDRSVEKIMIFIHLYSDDKHLCDVQKSYARLMIGGVEFCRYEVTQANDMVSDGCLMGCIYRTDPTQWAFQATGLYTKQLHSKEDLEGLMIDLCNHDYSATRIFNNRHDQLLPRVAPSAKNENEVSKIQTIFSENEELSVGFSWSLFLKIALDAKGYVLDEEGNILDYVDCEEKLEGAGLKHLGRLKTGEFKQKVDIKFTDLPENAHIIAFVVWSPKILNDYFRSGQMHFQLGSKKCYVVEMTNSSQEGLLIQYIVKDIHNKGYWAIGGSVKGMLKQETDQDLFKQYLDLIKFERVEHIERKFSPQSTINVAIQWNFVEDLGLSANCFLINDIGIIEGPIDQATSNQQSLNTLNTVENEEFDEFFKINFSRIPEHIRVIGLIITADIPVEGNLQSGGLQVQYEGKIQYRISFAGIQTSGILVLFIKRNLSGQWEISNYVKGFNAKSNDKLIDQYFHLTGMQGVNPGEIQKAQKWNVQNPKSIPITTEQVLPLPQSALELGFLIGLGWESKVDIDASVLMMDAVGNIYDNVFHQNLKSRDLSIQHHGDNKGGLTDGDDEMITVNLNKIDDCVQSLWVFINICDEGKTFDTVKGAYVRLVITNQEFCKYDVTQSNDGEQNGCLVAEISRKSGFWTVRGKGYYTQNTSSAESIIPILGKVFRGDLSQVKIFAQQDDAIKQQQMQAQAKKQLYNKPLVIGYQISGTEQVNGQVFLINEMGSIIDHVELYRVQSRCKSIKHLGIIDDGDYNQKISIELEKINPAALLLGVVIDTKHQSLTKVLDTGSKVDLIYDNQVYKSFKLKEEVDKALTVVFLKRNLKNPNWSVVTYNKKYFVAPTARKVIEDSLIIAGLNSQNVKLAYNWQPTDNVINMKSDQILPIPQCGFQSLIIGTGWDSDTDIDSAVLLMDKNGNLVDKVYYNNLKSKDWAVIHKGDAVKDQAEKIDDEEIEVKLDKLSAQVAQIWVFISVFQSGRYFDLVKNSFVRLLIGGKPFCRFDIGQIKDGESNGQLICQLYKYRDVNQDKWVIRSRGYYTQKTPTALEVIPIIKNIMGGNLSKVKLPSEF